MKAAKRGEVKLWRVKPKTDAEILNDIKDVKTDTILTCDCTCVECKLLYKSYLEVKVSNEILTESLNDERAGMTSTIEAITEQEKNFKERFGECSAALAIAEGRIKELNKSLEQERALRIEEIYRCDFQTKEYTEQLKELESAKKLANRLTIESQTYEFEKQQLQHKLNKMTDAYNKAMSQVKKYEAEVFHLEEKLDHFRIRVHSSDASVNQLKIRNENLVAKLNPAYNVKKGVRKSLVPSENEPDLETLMAMNFAANSSSKHIKSSGGVTSYANLLEPVPPTPVKQLTLADFANISTTRNSSSSSAQLPPAIGRTGLSSSRSSSIVGAGGGGGGAGLAAHEYRGFNNYEGVMNASGYQYREDDQQSMLTDPKYGFGGSSNGGSRKGPSSSKLRPHR